ncbi:MAG: GyrI-like domain-containing protein [Gemmatimonadota bacterium]
MKPTIVEQPPLRAACVHHRGPYHLIGEAFDRLHLDVTSWLHSDVALPLIAIFYDDPATVPPADLRSHAGIVLPPALVIPAQLIEVVLPGGRHLKGRHHGPYETLQHTWASLRENLQRGDGPRRRPGPSYEVYLNTPGTAAPNDLLTEIFIPVT